MCNEHFDVAIIGAGPAGLFLAKEILENSNQKVVLIDSGPSIKKRHCPLIQKGNCTKCPTCHVVEGVGERECIQMVNYLLILLEAAWLSY
ncbi:lycopene cyclase family protein [Bacillus velezensis]|nr:lycopene cyclase family protein [Bacillus velezensis]